MTDANLSEPCPSCGCDLYDEPTEACAKDPFVLLHWFAYLSEDRMCAGWLMGLQVYVTVRCMHPRAGWAFDEVTPEEANAILTALERCPGQWAWVSGDGPQWTPEDENSPVLRWPRWDLNDFKEPNPTRTT